MAAYQRRLVAALSVFFALRAAIFGPRVTTMRKLFAHFNNSEISRARITCNLGHRNIGQDCKTCRGAKFTLLTHMFAHAPHDVIVPKRRIQGGLLE